MGVGDGCRVEKRGSGQCGCGLIYKRNFAIKLRKIGLCFEIDVEGGRVTFSLF